MYRSVLLVALVACSGSAQEQSCTSDQRCAAGDVDAQTDPPGVSDAGIDAPPDGPGCPSERWVRGVSRCLTAAPTEPLSSATTVVIDTDRRDQCASTNDERYCVLAATQMTFNQGLRATGTRPIVLFAPGPILSTGLIDVASHRGDPDIGAGADPLVCDVSGPTAPGVGGGGAGGSFASAGGAGGAGAGVGGGPGAVSATLELRGGCPGQASQGGGTSSGGHGGGAVYFVSNTKISVPGGVNASGESGAGGSAAVGGGGGGGGAGGMIVFDAPVVTGNLILANGGGGGEGGSDNAAGARGADPTRVTPAPGGTGNPTGGDGGKGAALTPAEAGSAGTSGGGVVTGGGGGGGAGVVRAPLGATLTNVSPSVTP